MKNSVNIFHQEKNIGISILHLGEHGIDMLSGYKDVAYYPRDILNVFAFNLEQNNEIFQGHYSFPEWVGDMDMGKMAVSPGKSIYEQLLRRCAEIYADLGVLNRSKYKFTYDTFTEPISEQYVIYSNKAGLNFLKMIELRMRGFANRNILRIIKENQEGSLVNYYFGPLNTNLDSELPPLIVE